MSTAASESETLSKRLALFPLAARFEGPPGDEQLSIAGCSVAQIAEQHGTPLYLYDRATLDGALNEYRAALTRHYPGESGITYAGKAFLCLALAQWAEQAGLWVDCTGAGELAVVQLAGLDRRHVLVHGVNKSAVDLDAAFAHAGTIVVDHKAELERLLTLAQVRTEPLPALWLRIRPGIAVATHAHRQTGQEDSKFGMDPGEAEEAFVFCSEHGLAVTGLHFHLGSQFSDPEPVGQALEIVLSLVARLSKIYSADSRTSQAWSPPVLCPGGGWGIAYHEDDPPQPPISDYVRYIADRLVAGCRARNLPLLRLQLEPGRSLVARAGVAVYRVGAVKQTANRHWLLLDGGMSDNIRPALYGSRYTALPVRQPTRQICYRAWLAGPHCESGDILIEALPLPDIQPGELIAVPVSGAYHLSMSNNYNGACRPAVVWLDHGNAYLIRAREQVADLVRRDLPLPVWRP